MKKILFDRNKTTDMQIIRKASGKKEKFMGPYQGCGSV